MKASDIASSVKLLLLSGKVPLVLGPPGIGKTSVIEQVTAELGDELLVTRLADKEPVDLLGLPVVDMKSGTTKWLTPDEFPRGKKPITWFFDEWAQGLPTVQNVAGRLLNERKLGNYTLPDNVRIVAASNRNKDRAATNRIPGHIASRFTWLTMEADINDWSGWAAKNAVDQNVIDFLRWRDNLLSAYDPSADVSPNPRAWENVSDVRKMAKKQGMILNHAVEEAIYAGMVGPGAASEFMGVMQTLKGLGDPTAMLMNAASATLPTAPATLAALSIGISRKATQANMAQVVTLANRLPDEFSVLLIMLATKRDEALSRTRPYVDWSVKHADALG